MTLNLEKQLNDIQGKLGQLQQAVASQADAIEKLDSRLASTNEKITAINLRLAAAAAVIAVVVAFGGWVLKEVWDLAKPVVVQKLTSPETAKR